MIEGAGNVYVRSGLEGYPEFGPDCYGPDAAFPEYPWPSDLIANSNKVYENLRESLHEWGLDPANFGSANWNPLGVFVSPGDTVLIKPNWVSHRNNNAAATIDCLVTHTSLLRCAIDYCVIALNGSGRIIVADAPIQSADLTQLLGCNHVDELVAFYAERGVEVEIADLRLYRTRGRHGVYADREAVNSAQSAVEVDLGVQSRFAEIDASQRAYSVMDYSVDDTRVYHSEGHHVYSINRTVLEADVVINMPKPKTHRLAGMTGALKNMVGIVADKACLPHESIGPKSDHGDSYPGSSALKAASGKIRNFKAKQERRGRFLPALAARFADGFIRKGYLGRVDTMHFGAWFGNDTIWRTVHDLNLIVEFADRDGVMRAEPQRKILHIADMIVSGEGEGPLAPSAKKVGMVVLGRDALLVDVVISRLMGFDEQSIPTLSRAFPNIGIDLGQTEVEISGISGTTCDRVGGVGVSPAGPFMPCSGWVGHIELKKASDSWVS